MKKLLIVICLIISTCFVNAQSKQVNDDKIYTAVEQEPQFPGGQEKFFKSLQQVIHVPPNCLKDISDTKIVIEFVVEKNGRLTHIKTIKGGCPATNKQIIAFLRNSLKWEPGINAGRLCRVRYMIPIRIDLPQEE